MKTTQTPSGYQPLAGKNAGLQMVGVQRTGLQNSVLQNTGHHALEARVASRMATHLTKGTVDLSHDLAERLRTAREKALDRARSEQKQTESKSASNLSLNQDGSLTLEGGPRNGTGLPNWLSALVPLLMLLVGLWAISHLAQRERILVAADIDAQLLADDLPPAAYADPGFVQYLRRGAPP